MTLRRLHPARRYSDATVYNGVVYLAGQVADDAGADAKGQTAQVLATIDRLLSEAGTDKSQILMAQVFLADISDYDAMNAAWDDWVSPTSPPPRATVEARLAKAAWKVEIVVSAAVER